MLLRVLLCIQWRGCMAGPVREASLLVGWWGWLVEGRGLRAREREREGEREKESRLLLMGK